MYVVKRDNPFYNLVKNVRNNFPETINSVGGFAGMGLLTGAILGISYKFVPNNISSQVESNGIEAIIFTAAPMMMYARESYKNFKSEKKRWREYLIEHEKTKEIDKIRNLHEIKPKSNILNFEDYLTSYEKRKIK